MPSIAPPCHTRNDETTDSWITPKWLIDRLGPFDLDVCASTPQPWPCAWRQFTFDDNGLLQPWYGLVWCNPPYGAAAAAWLDRMALHNDGIALTFARTETRMFFAAVWPKASAIVFVRGRLTFARPDGSSPKTGHNSGGPSVLIGYGARAVDRLKAVADLGHLIELRALD
jgi:hypothetical protein